MGEKEHKQITDSVRETLDRSVEQLPAEVRSRSTQARHQALAAASRPRSARLYPWMLPAGGFAAVILTVLVWQGSPPSQLPESASAYDMQLLLTAEELDLVEDLDFLIWLQNETDAG